MLTLLITTISTAGKGSGMNEMSGKERWASHMDEAFRLPPVRMGVHTVYALNYDPKHLCFDLARYKFCAKLLDGQPSVLEIGCGDGFGLPLVAQAVGHVHATDTEPRVIEDDKERLGFLKNVSFETWDLSARPFPRRFSAAYFVDVIEHVTPSEEEAFLQNLCGSLEEDAVCIIGTPNVESSRFASESSRKNHVNWKSAPQMKGLLKHWFRNGFLFSMNDEIVHTGFYPMAHYLFAVGVGIRRQPGRTSQSIGDAG
jgi:SAM-dependent methyltransferase